jgi:putative nucleotidyltransferase with HDIG domain
MSNLLYLVDRVDALLASQGEHDIVNAGERVRQMISQYGGTLFAPELVQAFIEASSNEAFWLNLEPLNLLEHIARFKPSRKTEIDDEEDLRTLAFIFARIVDAKSPYTYEHSQGVARLSVFLARKMQLSPGSIFKIEIAALLHDLGKLGVPDEILEKKGPLNHDEKVIMHRHSYDTFRILRQIEGFEEISEWAGNHHETLIGDGYPFQKEEAFLEPGARIIAVADIFQALAQKRPYRDTLNPGEIVDLLSLLAEEGKVDSQIVHIVSEERERCWRIASGQD